MRPAARWLRSVFSIDRKVAPSELPPTFLCPSLHTRPYSTARHGAAFAPKQLANTRSALPLHGRRLLHATATPSATDSDPAHHDATSVPRELPDLCPGCGAFTQAIDPKLPGFFNLERKSNQQYLGLLKTPEPQERDGDEVVYDALQNLGPEKMKELGIDPEAMLGADKRGFRSKMKSSKANTNHIVCDRCHEILHHGPAASAPIFHPSVESVRETIEESPYKYNHVCHVLDAADFPMSLLPRINDLLDLMPLRSQNRRSKVGRFFKDQKTEMSFVITRSDLLAPTKEKVDKLMPWIRELLRERLGRTNRNVRLGNVRCVSAKRSWWTPELKEEIYKRGGATWIVGKANVGKSYLFQHVFPKGRMGSGKAKGGKPITIKGNLVETNAKETTEDETTDDLMDNTMTTLDEDSLLPPPQKETNYPQMPIVSGLAGTTASPIRVPFGGGKGELIDLPGLERSNLAEFVQPAHHRSLLMTTRIVPEQVVLKQFQSLLLGGFIRITPTGPDQNLVLLTYNFTPLREHRTMTTKAIEIQSQDTALNVENIAVPGTGAKTKLAGVFQLKYDVTKRSTGPITRRDAVNISVDRLPYRVLATDILIEGVGWVEISAQVRTRQLFKKPERLQEPPQKPASDSYTGNELRQTLDLFADFTNSARNTAPEPEQEEEPEPNWPTVEVYSPEGQFIDSRPPLSGWQLNKPRNVKLKQRPRKSMKGAKKMEKNRARAAARGEAPFAKALYL